ncbi:MAG: hypothetical protein HYV16_14070 [Gammaproteobacteria bacterium]|nr:hypothetical protein [Gammaproteobacteria bacterium]
MDIAKNLKVALSTINGTLSQLKNELASTNSQIGSINARIAELQAMPVSLADYGALLKGRIESYAGEHADYLEFEWFRNAPSMGCTPFNKIPFNHLAPNGELAMFPPALFGPSGLTPRAACFFFGDQIYESLMKRAQAKFGKRWGNEELPTVEERRKTIAELEAQGAALAQRRAELEAQIDEIAGALAG